MGAILDVTNLSKSFPGVKALTSIDFSLEKGEIHALMGENGAGKSTLIKVITGFHKRDSGAVIFGGKSIDYSSPHEAVLDGISTVYQEINLIPMLSVAENIYLGRQPLTGRGKSIDWGELTRGAELAMAQLDMAIDVSLPLGSYSVAIQQMVSIARALDISADILILDEPTSSLDGNEASRLFNLMRKLKNKGLSIIFVTHFLDQVFEISDRITVLRNGRKVGLFNTGDISKMELITSMLGKALDEFDDEQWKREEGSRGEEYLSVSQLGKEGFLKPFDLEVHRGEVLGLAGLLGSGRSEIAQLLYGITRPDQGTLSIRGKNEVVKTPRRAISLGMGFCPEDRKTAGIIPELTVRDNIILALQAKRGVFRYLSRTQRDKIASEFITSLNIVTPGADQSVKNLSGGNQQKVILARWLAANPEFLILDEPTRGIDIGAKIEIQKLILKLKKKGLAILFISSELEEVVRCSSRIAVLRDRKKVADLSSRDVTEKKIMQAIAEE